MAYWVYILKSDSTGRYYVGHTNDLEDRVHRHNDGRTAVNRGPWRLVYREQFPTRQAAITRERAIKYRKSRTYIEALCSRLPVG